MSFGRFLYIFFLALLAAATTALIFYFLPFLTVPAMIGIGIGVGLGYAGAGFGFLKLLDDYIFSPIMQLGDKIDSLSRTLEETKKELAQTQKELVDTKEELGNMKRKDQKVDVESSISEKSENLYLKRTSDTSDAQLITSMSSLHQKIDTTPDKDKQKSVDSKIETKKPEKK